MKKTKLALTWDIISIKESLNFKFNTKKGVIRFQDIKGSADEEIL